MAPRPSALCARTQTGAILLAPSDPRSRRRAGLQQQLQPQPGRKGITAWEKPNNSIFISTLPTRSSPPWRRARATGRCPGTARGTPSPARRTSPRATPIAASTSCRCGWPPRRRTMRTAFGAPTSSGRSQGAQVRKGEKSTVIVFYKELETPARGRSHRNRNRPVRPRLAGVQRRAGGGVRAARRRRGAARRPHHTCCRGRGFRHCDRGTDRHRRGTGVLSSGRRSHPDAGPGTLHRHRDPEPDGRLVRHPPA